MVFKSTDGVNFSQIGWTGTISYTDSAVIGGQTYYYYVKSWNGGQPSNVAMVVAQ
jgi:hypothetical protein